MAPKILVVDDEEDYRLIIRDTLEEAGYEVREAADGRAAIQELDGGYRPDVLLVDWMMPRMDGQSLVRTLRGGPHKGVPVVMLTVRQTEADELEALHFGVDDYLVKPFEAEDLLARLRAVLRRAKA